MIRPKIQLCFVRRCRKYAALLCFFIVAQSVSAQAITSAPLNNTSTKDMWARFKVVDVQSSESAINDMRELKGFEYNKAKTDLELIRKEKQTMIEKIENGDMS